MIIQHLKNYKRPDLFVFLRVCHQFWNQFQKKQSAEEAKRFLLHYFQLLEDFEYQALFVQFKVDTAQEDFLTEKTYFEQISPYIQLTKYHLARVFFQKQFEHISYLIEELGLENLERFLYLDLLREGHIHSSLVQQVLKVERNPIEYEALTLELKEFSEKQPLLKAIEEDRLQVQNILKDVQNQEVFLNLMQSRKDFLVQFKIQLEQNKKGGRRFPLQEILEEYFFSENEAAEQLCFAHLEQSFPLREKSYTVQDLLQLTDWILSVFPSYFEALMKRVDEHYASSIERVERYRLEEVNRVLSLFPAHLTYTLPHTLNKMLEKMTQEEGFIQLLKEKNLYFEDFIEDFSFSRRFDALAQGHSNFFSKIYNFSSKAQGIYMLDADASKQFAIWLQAYSHLKRRQDGIYLALPPLKEECLKVTGRLIFFSLLKKDQELTERFSEYIDLAEYSFFIEVIFTLVQNAFLYLVQQKLYQSSELNEQSYEQILKWCFKKYFPYLDYSEDLLKRLGFLPHLHEAFYKHPVFFEEQLLARISALGIWSLYQQETKIKEEDKLNSILKLYQEQNLQDFFCQLADLNFPSPFDPILQKRLSFQLAFYLHF